MTNPVIDLDGSQGGGQLLRTALSLSAILQEPFRMGEIRGAREKGGLKAQHLAAVNAVAKICGARVQGATLGSSELSFSPGPIAAGTYSFDIGTAGSATLVLQALWPVLLFAGAPSSVTVRGGTAVAWSPSSTYVEQAFLPLARRTGANVSLFVAQWGFYPRGGGELRSRVHPARRLKPLELTERGERHAVTGVATVANLPLAVSEREQTEVLKLLAGRGVRHGRFDARAVPARDAGNECYVHAPYAKSVAGFSALGEKGKPAAKVAAEAVNAFLAFDASGACVDAHAADQLLLYAALAEGESRLVTPKRTDHVRTNAGVIEAFLGARVSMNENAGVARIRVNGAGVERRAKA